MSTDPRKDAMSDRDEIRRALADYMDAEGCSCCRNNDKHDAAKATLAKLLRVPKYADGSGFDFGRFETKVTP